MFSRLCAGLAGECAAPGPVLLVAPPLPVPCPGGPPAHKGALSRRVGRTRGGRNAERAACTADGHPLTLLLPAGQVRTCRGAEGRACPPPDAYAALSNRRSRLARLCGSLTGGHRLARRDDRCAHP